MVVASSSSSSRRVSCFGFISPRSATLFLSILGLVIHVQQFNYLKIVHDTFPHVPLPRAAAHMPPTLVVNDASRGTSSSSAALGAKVVLDSEVGNHTISKEGLMGLHPSSSSSSNWKDAAAAPVRWFNLLPSRYQSPDGKEASGSASTTDSMTSDAYVEQDWKARLREQEKDRKSWEAARRLTKVIRFYALMCVLASLCGIYGVVRSNLLSTRLFVLSYTLDLMLCALSLVSLGIIVSYPNIRGLICEELSTTSAVIMDLDESSTHTLPPSPGPVMLLGRAASTFWKRAMTEASRGGAESLHSPYWWDSVLDNLFEYDNCDEVLESVLIPLGLFTALIYLALRIHFLVVLRHYYVSLLRDQMSYHLSLNSSGCGVNERKYSSSSSASSSASTTEFASCLPSSSKSSRFDVKVINEKMA